MSTLERFRAIEKWIPDCLKKTQTRRNLQLMRYSVKTDIARGRREFTRLASSLLAAGFLLLCGPMAGAAEKDDALAAKLAEIEARLGGRLGAAIVDTETGREWRHRADERFPMASTFKAFACAAVLARVDAGKEDLNRSVHFHKNELVTYSPITENHADGKGMTLFELCDAATSMSDNTAANLVLDSLGGPAGLTKFMRSIEDKVTRLDRKEPELNEATPGDPRDTTTPNAIVTSLRKLVLEDALSTTSREQLTGWLIANKVGGPLLRAGLPESWKIADRTGAGAHGSRGIVAVIWPPARKPVIAAIYVTETKRSMDERNAAFAEIGRALAATLSDN